MFKTRAIGRIKGPSIDEVRSYAKANHLHVPEEALPGFTQALTGMLAAFDRLDEIDESVVSSHYHWRDPGRPPLPEEDPYNAFVRFCEVRGADEGPLAGKRVAVKDCIAVAGIPQSNGGRRLPYHVPTEDAVVVERILDAGATIVAKTNMEDLALGFGEGSFFGAARNPKDAAFSTGGSSSGSAAAVAAGQVDMALGADEAGSIRIPSAWCGLVGMKATHGLVPSYGMTYMDHTIDHIGPITSTVADNALMLEVIAGSDWRDPQWVRAEPTSKSYTSAAKGGIEGLKIGVVQESLAPSGSSPKTLASLEAGLAKLEAAGARVTPVHIPLWLDAWPIENGVLTFGLAAMFASGGQGYGHLGRVDTELLAVTAAQNRLQSRDLPLMLKMMVITADYLRDAYLGVHFGKAQNLRLELRRQITQTLADVDVLVTPTTPTGPFRLLEEPTTDEALLAGMRLDVTFNTSPLDLSGHPALTVPCGTCEEDMPVGMQIIGRHFDEMMVYRVGFAAEAAFAASS